MRKPYREPYACLKQPVKPAGVCLRFAFDAFLADLASGAFFADQLAYLKLDTVTPQDLVLVFRANFFPSYLARTRPALQGSSVTAAVRAYGFKASGLCSPEIQQGGNGDLGTRQ